MLFYLLFLLCRFGQNEILTITEMNDSGESFTGLYARNAGIKPGRAVVDRERFIVGAVKKGIVPVILDPFDLLRVKGRNTGPAPSADPLVFVKTLQGDFCSAFWRFFDAAGNRKTVGETAQFFVPDRPIGRKFLQRQVVVIPP